MGKNEDLETTQGIIGFSDNLENNEVA